MDEVNVNEDSAIKQNLLNETIVASAVESNQSLGDLFCDRSGSMEVRAPPQRNLSPYLKVP